MKCSRAVSALFALAFLAATSRAQGGRVVVEQSGSKELKRTAHRLRISTDQLKKTRAVLQEATELARKLDPAPVNSYPQLGEAWIQLNRTQAVATIDSLYSGLRAAAAKSPDLQSYQQGSFSAQALMSALAELDSEHALQLLRQWPDPPAALGEDAVNFRNQIASQSQIQMTQRMIYRDPNAALKLMPELSASGTPGYSIRGQLALQLMRTGQKDQAVKIADQVIADFQQRTPDQRSAQEYASFLQSYGMVDPDRFVDALGALLPVLGKQLPGADYAMTLRSGDQSAMFTSSESMILNMFRGFQGRPQLAMKTLDSFPDLKAKLDSVGGIDNFLNSGGSSGSLNITYGNPSGMGKNNSPTPPGAGKDLLSSLYAELRGKSQKDPALVRTKLNEVASNPALLDTLTGLAQRASYEDPDLCSIAVQVAAEQLPRIDPVQRRANILQNLLGAYRQCEGEVDPELLRNGFIIADKLRQEEERANPGNPNRKNAYGSPADQLDATLIAEYARDNYDAAMRFLRSKPDDSIKLLAMLRVLQALRSSY